MKTTTLAAALLSLAFLASACAAPTSDDGEPEEVELHTTSTVTIAVGDDGRMFVPGLSAELYLDGVHLDPGGVLVLENTGTSRRTIIAAFDGPPMLDPAHEIHTSRTVDLAPSESVRLHAPSSRGHYRFRCGGDASCPGLDLGDGNGEWRPMVTVSSS